MLKNKKILIVGAGITGITLANILSKNNNIVLMQQRQHIGGNCYDYKDEFGNIIQQYGPHLFHTNHQIVWNYISKFSKWHFYQHKVLCEINNQFFNMPININTINKYFGLKLKNQEQMRLFLQTKRIKIDNPQNAEQQLLSVFGEQIYQNFYKYYTIKQWNKQPKFLPPQIVNRIPIYYSFQDRYFTDKWQYMPTFGYTQLFNQMLTNKNIEVIFETYKKNYNKNFDIIFYTGRIDQYFDYKYDQLQYRSVEFIKEIKDCYLQYPVCVINYPEKDKKYTRISEIKHATKVKTKNTYLFYEFPLQNSINGKQMYVVNDKKNSELLLKYNTQKYKENNVHFLGRLATYKYINMDQAIFNVINYLYNNKLCGEIL